MEQSRSDLACEVMDNLCYESNLNGFSEDLLIFDNASKYHEHLLKLPSKAKLVRSSSNIGYWSAINWTLNNYHSIFNREYKYIYIIESDLIHKNMSLLKRCESFLEDNSSIGAIRTQEFSVKFNFLYNKRFNRLPFVRKRSLVKMSNAITNEKIWFHKTPDPIIYITNLHTKLPALNRIEAIKDVFNKLSFASEITEMDFIRLYYHHYSLVAVLDGGIFVQRSYKNAAYISGSWSEELELEKLGYRKTRTDKILTSGFSVK